MRSAIMLLRTVVLETNTARRDKTCLMSRKVHAQIIAVHGWELSLARVQREMQVNHVSHAILDMCIEIYVQKSCFLSRDII